MMNKSIITKLTIIGFVLSSLIMAPSIFANTSPYGAFNVIPQLPDNQVSEMSSYFDLKMDPGVEQTISFDIVNSGDEPMIAAISLNNGTTGSNAEKIYDSTGATDESMVMPMTEMAQLEKEEVTVKPHETERVHVTVNSPKEPFDGVSVGGITVTADTVREHDEKKNGFSIDNRLAYVIAIQIRMTDHVVAEHLNYRNSDASYGYDTTHFVSYVQNDQARVMNGITIDGVIKDVDGRIVATASKENGGILPNTSFTVSYDLVNDEQLEAGDYSVNLKIKSETNEWEWDDTVTLDYMIMDTLGNEVQHKVILWPIITIASVILLVGLLVSIKCAKRKEQ